MSENFPSTIIALITQMWSLLSSRGLEVGTATIVGSVCWRRTIRLKNRNKLDLKCKHHVMWSGQWWRQRRSGPGPLHHGKVARKPKNNYSPGLLRGGKKRSRGHQRVGSEARTTGDTEGTAQPAQPAQRSAPANEVAAGPRGRLLHRLQAAGKSNGPPAPSLC